MYGERALVKAGKLENENIVALRLDRGRER